MAKRLVPKTHILKSIRSRNWTLAGAMGELVDNSLGHGRARNVQILIDNAEGIAVADDGIGIDNINRIFWYGDASDYDTLSQIGQYGVGAKHATIWLGDLVEVTTVRDGRQHKMAVDWLAVEESGNWPLEYTGAGSRPRPNGRGTRIWIRHPAHIFPLTASEALARELGQIFAPALRNGVRINITHLLKDGYTRIPQVVPFEPAGLTGVIEIAGSVETVRGELKWTGRVGVSEQLRVRDAGVHISFGHRVIEQTLEPFKGESAPTLYVEVQLDDTTPWKHSLSEHKDRVVHNREALMSSIHEQIAEMLQASARQAKYLALRLMTAPIETQLTKALKGAGILHVDPDEPPEEGGEHGKTDKPVKPGKRLRTPTEEGDPAREANKPTGVKIDFLETEALDGALWRWDVSGRLMTIWLDRAEFEPTVKWPPDVRDRHVVQLVAALLSYAIESEWMNHDAQLVGVITPKLRDQIDAWASTENKIAPYLNRAIVTGVAV